MTTDSQIVGVYIPFWGELAYLREAVASVQAQTTSQWRLTVVNDAHPDTSVDEFFASLEDDRIHYIRNPENLGITANFRNCVQMAREALVVVMGYDDLLLPGYVEAVLRAHTANPTPAIIQPGVVVVDENGHQVSTLVDTVKQRVLRPQSSRIAVLEGDKLGAGLMHGDWLYWPSLAFRREVIQRHDFRDEFSVIQDLALILDIVLAGEQLMVIPDKVFCYRRHSSSASSLELIDGSRFDGERRFFQLAAQLSGEKSWFRTHRAAKLHLTSRAHAAVLLPRAVLKRDLTASRILIRHLTALD